MIHKYLITDHMVLPNGPILHYGLQDSRLHLWIHVVAGREQVISFRQVRLKVQPEQEIDYCGTVIGIFGDTLLLRDGCAVTI